MTRSQPIDRGLPPSHFLWHRERSQLDPDLHILVLTYIDLGSTRSNLAATDHADLWAGLPACWAVALASPDCRP